MSKQGLSHSKLIVLSTTQEDHNEYLKLLPYCMYLPVFK